MEIHNYLFMIKLCNRGNHARENASLLRVHMIHKGIPLKQYF
jgi:hypothetical protein